VSVRGKREKAALENQLIAAEEEKSHGIERWNDLCMLREFFQFFLSESDSVIIEDMMQHFI
jgi:hypothetical protein